MREHVYIYAVYVTMYMTGL